jgi:transposase
MNKGVYSVERRWTYMKRRTFTSKQKLQIVLESIQRDTTIEAVRRKYGMSSSVINRWRAEFLEKAVTIFEDKRSLSARRRAGGYEPGQSPEELKKLIGELAVQNEILKKAEGLLGAQ